MQGKGVIQEMRIAGGAPSACVVCEPGLVPAPGRYVLAHEEGSNAPLAKELFAAEYRHDGFIAAPPIPKEWSPGCRLDLRGPLGKGFSLAASARRVALIAWDNDARRLLPLAAAGLRQGAAVALVCGDPPADISLELEIHPPTALAEVCAWCDYAAFDVERDSLGVLVGIIAEARLTLRVPGAQVLVRAPMPCGGLAECGVCTVRTARGQRLACVDGPVFDLTLLIPKF